MVAPSLASTRPDVALAPVPPNVAKLLDHGVRNPGQGYTPLVLRVRPDVSADDVRCVLTAVVNHHDALRLTVASRSGTWEQRIAPPDEFTNITTLSLSKDGMTGSNDEQAARLAVLAEYMAEHHSADGELAAVYLPGAGAAPSFLALAVPQLAGDHASCTILATDIRTAFAHRLAGEAISLQSVPTSWHEWSQRCAERAQHSSASEHLDFDFEKFAHATLRVVDHDIASRPHASDLARLSAPMTNMLTTELDEAQRYLRLTTEEILIAALGRTIARTIGQGLVAIDVAGDSRFVLDTSVDLRRTVGWFTTTYPVAIDCITDRRASATEMVGAVHRTLAAVAHRVYAPPAPHRAGQRSSDILFSYIGGGLEPSAALSVRETLPALGHALEVRVYRNAGQLHMDWWYDTRRFFDSTVEELSEQFPLALIELTSEAMPPNDEAEIVVATWR